jgi:hypothetical protein
MDRRFESVMMRLVEIAVVGDEIVGLDANSLVGSGQWFQKIITCRSTGSGNQIAPESDIFKGGRGDGLPRELSLVAV